MLYIVATPIGNLEDITLRALRILKEADFVLSEDTRVTKKLLSHFEIKAKTISFHEHSDSNKYKEILNLLLDGKNLALVSDAGTPGIQDPGARLINFLRENNYHEISPVPGPSALATLFSVSGLEKSEFTFLGFPPHKKGRETFFKKIADLIEENKIPIIIYESKHRIEKTLKSLEENLPKNEIILAKELTKINERIFRGIAKEIIQEIKTDPNLLKGEFVLLIK